MNGPVEGSNFVLVPGIMGCTLWILRDGWIAAVVRIIHAAGVLAVVDDLYSNTCITQIMNSNQGAPV